jgi:hypothetical protein
MASPEFQRRLKDMGEKPVHAMIKRDSTAIARSALRVKLPAV